MRVADVLNAARLTVAETDGGPRITKYVPFDKGIVLNAKSAGERAKDAEVLS